jgi:hypothetical protein
MDGAVGGERVTRVTAVGGVPVLPSPVLSTCLPGCHTTFPPSVGTETREKFQPRARSLTQHHRMHSQSLSTEQGRNCAGRD